jgi:hypothetical protein
VTQFQITKAKNSSISTSHERRLPSDGLTVFVSAYRVDYVGIYNTWGGYTNCCAVYKKDGLQLAICVCYSLEMALIVDLDALFGNM